MPVCHGLHLPRIRAATTARCEDCGGHVFQTEEVALLWTDGEPGARPPRFCPHCEATRDVLGIPFDRTGPVPDGEIRRLSSEPREMGG
jgi:hypothetical protein